jgi:hypothetical protein
MTLAARLRLATREVGVWCSVAVLALCAASAANAFGPASDYADAAAYADGWTDGDDGGTGWNPDYPWTFSTAVAPFAIESSTLNGDGDSDGDGDIDTNGKAFTMVALNSSLYYAVRFLYPVPLQVGERVAFDFDAVGSGALYFASCALMEYTDTPQQRWGLQVAGDATNYGMIDSTGVADLGVPIGDEGIHVEFDLTGADTYTSRVTPLGGASTERSGALAGSGDIVAFLCAIGGGGAGTYKAYFNSIVIPEPGATASALAAALAIAAARRRRA